MASLYEWVAVTASELQTTCQAQLLRLQQRIERLSGLLQATLTATTSDAEYYRLSYDSAEFFSMLQDQALRQLEQAALPETKILLQRILDLQGGDELWVSASERATLSTLLPCLLPEGSLPGSELHRQAVVHEINFRSLLKQADQFLMDEVESDNMTMCSSNKSYLLAQDLSGLDVFIQQFEAFEHLDVILTNRLLEQAHCILSWLGNVHHHPEFGISEKTLHHAIKQLRHFEQRLSDKIENAGWERLLEPEGELNPDNEVLGNIQFLREQNEALLAELEIQIFRKTY